MKRIKKDKVKRGRIILSAILTFALAVLSLGFGAYMGYITLNINYVTIGTMTPKVGGLLVVAGFFIFFGCIGGVISLKELFIAHRNEEKFSAYKGSLISAIVFYCVIALISIMGIISSFISYVPSQYTWGVIGLGALSLILSAGCFYCVFKELKEHKKKTKQNSQPEQGNINDNGAFNMNLDAGQIYRFSNMTNVNDSGLNASVPLSNVNQNYNFSQQQNQKPFSTNQSGGEGARNNLDENKVLSNFQKEQLQKVKDGRAEKSKEDLNFVSLAEQLMQLEELRKAGLINDQEYQELKRKCIWFKNFITFKKQLIVTLLFDIIFAIKIIEGVQMKKFFSDFKAFISRGNILDMAVGVIVGGAFNAIVTAFTNKIIMPLINLLLSVGGENGLEKAYTFLKVVKDSEGQIDLTKSIYIDWGAFITAIINFFIIAFTLFVILKVAMKSSEMFKKTVKDIEKASPTKEEKKELKARGYNKKDRTAYKAGLIALRKEREEAKKAEEARLEAEKAKVETDADVLRDIRDLLKAQAKENATQEPKTETENKKI